MNNKLVLGVIVFVGLVLGGCGGGGGDGDKTPPIVTAPTDITVEAPSAAGTSSSEVTIAAFLASSTAVDAVDGTTLSFSHDAPDTFPLGVTVVTFSYTDKAGNTGTATATVTISDTIAPVVTAPANITVEAPGTTAIATFLAGSSATDAVDSAPVFTHDAPANFPLGATVVTFTHTDASGNAGTDFATVTVNDTANPGVTAPADITVEAESSAGTPESNSAIAAFLTGSSVVDAGDPSPTLSHDAPAPFPLGATLVTFTYTDWVGNIGTATATVTISDTTAPVITLIGADPLTVALLSTFSDQGSTITDAVDTGLTATVTGTVDNSIGGAYILSYDVTDTAGNVATTVTRTVNVEVATPTNVSFTVSGKHLNFTWDAATALDHWRISENPDGASGFTVNAGASNIVSTATGFSLEIPVHLTDWVNAQYIVEACDGSETQCKSSPNQTLVQTDSVDGIFYVKASNTGFGDFFGSSVSISGDGNTLAVGAWQETSNATGINGDEMDDSLAGAGAVYVFSRSGTTWVQQAYVKASNTDEQDNFGMSAVTLSADGNTLAVGAHRESSNATGINGDETNNLTAQSGAVYVFSRVGTAWTQQAYVKASLSSSAHFGNSASLSADGNTLAVGAWNEAGASTGIGGDQTITFAGRQSGAVYVFTRTGSTWTQQEYIKASNAEALDQFGKSVSISGDGNTLAVGAYREDSAATGIDGDQTDNSINQPGAVYVFTRSGATWTQQAYVKASNTGPVDNFGTSVALSADSNTLAVGANLEGGSGAVYVFNRNGSTWSQQAYVKASNTGTADDFGSSVSLNANGNTLAVGAWQEDSDSTGVGGGEGDSSTAQNSGAVYVFTRNGTTWAQKTYVKASNTGANDRLGAGQSSVSLNADGDTLAVGSELERSNTTGIGGDQTDNSAGSAGAVYLY